MLLRAGLVETHPIFKVYPGQVDAIRELFGFKDAKSLDDAVDVLEAWVKQQNHFLVKDFGRDYLESYIIMAKGSIEKAKKRLDKRCTIRNMMPELFTNIRVDTEFTQLFNSYLHGPIPLPTKDYYRISVDKFGGDIESFDHLQYARYLHVCAEYSMVNELIVGLECIVDMQGLAFTDVMKKFNPVVLQKIMIMLIEGYGAKLKAIHIINSSKFVENIVAMLKTGLSEKIKNRLHVHSTPETLHNFIAKDCLPSDYGGTGPSINECHDMFYKELCTDHFKQRLKQVEHFQTDETRRITSKFNDEYMGMPGSFRKLSVD